MKFCFIILFQFFILSIYAQDDKPRYYYDEDESQISDFIYKEKVTQGKNRYKYLKLNFQNDTCYVSLIVRRKNYGRLKQIEFDSLQKSLTNGINPPLKKYTVIQYHPGADKCNSGKAYPMPDKKSVFKERFLKKLDEDVGIQNYWIHKKDKQVQYHKIKSIDWQLDKNETVEKLFFKLHYPCHSFVIVDNFSKNYISFFGEYHSQQIVVFVKEMNKSQ